MDRGIYTAASGGLYSLRNLDLVGNNLANVNTVGYKAQRLVSRQQSFEDTLAGVVENTPARAKGDLDRAPGVVDVQTITDFSPGPLSQTNNPLDVALVAPGQFFSVQTEEGEQLTRAGNFRLNNVGELVTPDGLSVMGEGGPIVLTPGAKPAITSDGTVTANGEVVGKLRVSQVADVATLERKGGARFVPKAGGVTPVDSAEVVPGAVELPNINVVQAMVEMISAQRQFEAYTKLAREINDLDETTIRNAGRAGGI